jgi:hypothetical protein
MFRNGELNLLLPGSGCPLQAGTGHGRSGRAPYAMFSPVCGLDLMCLFVRAKVTTVCGQNCLRTQFSLSLFPPFSLLSARETCGHRRCRESIKPVEEEGQEQDARKGNGRMRSLPGLALYVRGTVWGALTSTPRGACVQLARRE